MSSLHCSTPHSEDKSHSVQVGRDILFVQVVSHNESFMFIIAVDSEFVLNNLSSGASTSLYVWFSGAL